MPKKNLRVRCGDQRLGAVYDAMMEEKLGTAYQIRVPGPDKGLYDDSEHLEHVMYFVRRFLSLVSFNEVFVETHEDCAGCQCSVAEHEAYALSLAEKNRQEEDCHAEVKAGISRRPKGDDFSCWDFEVLAPALAV